MNFHSWFQRQTRPKIPLSTDHIISWVFREWTRQQIHLLTSWSKSVTRISLVMWKLKTRSADFRLILCYNAWWAIHVKFKQGTDQKVYSLGFGRFKSLETQLWAIIYGVHFILQDKSKFRSICKRSSIKFWESRRAENFQWSAWYIGWLL